jgi:hypothetical protein
MVQPLRWTLGVVKLALSRNHISQRKMMAYGHEIRPEEISNLLYENLASECANRVPFHVGMSISSNRDATSTDDML